MRAKQNILIECLVLLFFMSFTDLSIGSHNQLNGYRIVVPANPIPVEIYAAEELKYHLEKALPGKIEIISDLRLEEKSNNIFIGQSTGNKNLNGKIIAAEANAYEVTIFDENLHIFGDDSSGDPLNLSTHAGTLFGVYEFLEKILEVQWIWPGKTGEVIPKICNLDFRGEMTLIRRTRLVYSRWRDSGIIENREGWKTPKVRNEFIKAQKVWLRRHRFSTSFGLGYGHGFTKYWEKYYQSNPGIFNLLPDNTRRPDPYHWRGNPRLISMDVTNHELWSIIINNWKNTRTEKLPWVNGIENDTPGKCTCDRCLSFLAEGVSRRRVMLEMQSDFKLGRSDWYKAMGSLTDRYIYYYLNLLELAKSIDPKAKVIGYAYKNYRIPPSSETLNNDVILEYVPDLSFPWHNSQVFKASVEISEWCDTGASVILRPNFMLDGHNMPIYFANKLGDFLTHAFQAGVVGIELDSLTGQYGTQGPNLYVVARKISDYRFSTEKILDGFYSAFGAAGFKVRKYFQYWDRVSSRGNIENIRWVDFLKQTPSYFNESDFDFALQILNEAKEEISPRSIEFERILFLENGLSDAKRTFLTHKEFLNAKANNDFAQFEKMKRSLYEHRKRNESPFVSNVGFLNWIESRHWH